MSSSNDYILVTGSRNLNDGSSDSDASIHEEGDDASLNALEGQGVSILGSMGGHLNSEASENAHFDRFTQELMDQGGIEIVQGDDEDESIL